MTKLESSSNNKRLAKNTALLYVRMLLTMAVNLYTSRVVLSTLGVEDFGIYSVVGGVVAMFSFLNAALSGCTSRFLTFEMGAGNRDGLKKVFSSSLIIHIGIALAILILAETIGLWYVKHKLVISEGREFAAQVVYQFSILASIVALMRLPYNAAIISHERMGIYAYVSILEAFLKLGIVYVLLVVTGDKLITYGILTFVVTLLIFFVYQIYCIKKFEEAKFSFSHIDKKIMLAIGSYSTWDLYGNLSIIVRGQGIVLLLNAFFGVVVNAASAIANQVQNAVAGFAESFLVALRPQIVKTYAAGQIKEMEKLLCNGSRYSFFLLFLISLPLIIENEFVLTLWLKDVPDYTVVFCQLSLINNLVAIAFRAVTYVIHATGKIKGMSFITGTIYILVLPISYLFLKAGGSPVIPFVINVLLVLLGCLFNLYLLKRNVPSVSISEFFRKVVFVCIYVAIAASIFPVIVYSTSFDGGWSRFILVVLASITSVILSVLFLGMKKDERYMVLNQLRKMINRK